MSRVINKEDIIKEVDQKNATDEIKEILDSYNRMSKYGRIKALLSIVDELSKEE